MKYIIKIFYGKAFEKAQISLEILIVIGVLMIGAIGLGLILINHTNSATDNSTETEGVNSLVTTFTGDADNYMGSNNSTSLLSANINSPSNGASFQEGADVHFIGLYSQDSGNVTCSWESALTGSVWTGCDVVVNNLTVGIHDIELTVTDAGSTATDHVEVIITSVPDPLQVSITSPISYSNYILGQTINLNSTITGGSGVISCTWFANTTQIASNCNDTINSLSEGVYDISIRVNDDDEGTVVDTVSGIKIDAGSNINLNIIQETPSTGAATYPEETMFEFTSTATCSVEPCVQIYNYFWYDDSIFIDRADSIVYKDFNIGSNILRLDAYDVDDVLLASTTKTIVIVKN